jgi:hypothetical protein
MMLRRVTDAQQEGSSPLRLYRIRRGILRADRRDRGPASLECRVVAASGYGPIIQDGPEMRGCVEA